MHLRYDEDRVKPVHKFEADAHSLTIGVGEGTVGWTNHKSDGDPPELRVALARTVPMDLSLALGATQTMVDLGGLTLRKLQIESGAAEAKVDFSAPNRTRMRALELQIGAASVTIRNLANANTSSLRVDGGVGAIDLGFGGTWTGDMDAQVTVAIGKVTLHVPRDVGIRLDLSRFLASFDSGGLEKRDGAYYSDNWESARYHLRLHVNATLGAVELDRSGSSAND
jgi:hypothetical protein